MVQTPGLGGEQATCSESSAKTGVDAQLAAHFDYSTRSAFLKMVTWRQPQRDKGALEVVLI